MTGRHQLKMLPAGALLLWGVCLTPGARLPLSIAALVILVGVSTRAAEYDGRRISTIQFEPAAQPLPLDEIRRLLPLKEGDVFSGSQIREGIQKLYATGRYSDISVDATLAGNDVALRFITALNYFVGRVTVEGAPDPPNKGQLTSATKLQLGVEFADNDLRQATENLQERLRANGLFKAHITPELDREPAIEQANIDFTVVPGDRAKFKEILVDGQPDRPLSSIIRATKWRRIFGIGWHDLTENRIQTGLEGVRNLYLKHNHLLAKVNLKRLDYDEATNQVTPTLGIEAGPVVKVTTKGARVSKGKLNQLLPIYQERSVDRSLLVEGRRNLIEYFQSQGYFDADVDFEYLPVEKNQATIEYRIERDRRHKLSYLEILGNKYFDVETLRERMYLMPASLLRFRHGRYSQRYLERDVDAIQELYRSNGFRDVQVTPKIIDDYQSKEGDIAVQLSITEGPQWFVSGLEITGMADADQERILPLLHSTTGQAFSEFNVATDRDTILTHYYNNGFPDASFDWSQTLDEKERMASLKYVVKPGNRRYVRNVIINGLEGTNPGLVEERIAFKPGDALSQAKMADSQRRLYDLGIFAKVQTAIQNPEGSEESKYVLYQFEEARRYSFNAGFGAEIARIGGGVTTFDAPAGAAGFAPRVSLGVSRLNFLGLGHTISLQTRASTLQRRGLVSYFAPQFKGNENLSLTFTGLFDDTRDVRTFAAKRIEGSAQLGQRLSRANTLQYRFTYRDVRVDPDSVKITPQLIPILSQSVRVGQLSATFIQDRRDDPTDSHKGVYNTIDFGVAARQFGSQTSFVRINMRNSSYHRLSRDLVLARSTNFGAIERIGGLPEIPLPEHIFSGGSSSHRAFPNNQAGPRDTITGFPLGGNALFMNSVELRFPLIGDNVGGVLFHDAGNVYSSVRDISFRYKQRELDDFNYMVHAVGLGIRYRTPVGPIRVDLAVGPNSPRFFGFKGTREELLTCAPPGATGANTCPSVAQRISVFQFHFSLGQTF